MSYENYCLTEIKRAKKFMNSGITDPSDSEEDENSYYRCPMEWLGLVSEMLCCEGPIVVDLNIYKHALGCYSEDELTEFGVKEEDDLVVIGDNNVDSEEDPKMITLKDLNDFFDTVLSKTWPEGRTYYMNGIYNKYQHKWVEKCSPTCDYFVNWDS